MNRSWTTTAEDGTQGNPLKPCGACDRLIHVAIGCKHWRPQQQNPQQRDTIRRNNKEAQRRCRAKHKQV